MFETLEQIRDQLRAGEDGRSEFNQICFGDRAVPSPDTEELADEPSSRRFVEYVFDEQPVLAAAVEDINRNRLEAFFGRSPTIGTRPAVPAAGP